MRTQDLEPPSTAVVVAKVSFAFMAHLAPLMSMAIDHETRDCVLNPKRLPQNEHIYKPAHKICKKGYFQRGIYLSHARQLEAKSELKRSAKITKRRWFRFLIGR